MAAPPPTSPSPRALDAWRSALGAEQVGEGEVLPATFETGGRRVQATLRPGTRDEVRACLRIAREHGVPVYPVSAGKNWGYGSRAPWRDGCVLLDLGRLNRIVWHDEALATLTVEPGVTFAQAHAFLAERGSRLCLAVTGGPPGGSLIGNALERGDGAGPLGDVFRHVCGLEVLLANGDTLHTGHARFARARTARTFRWGVGPALDGLFSQSNLGVVTEMTFFLAPRPAYRRQFLGMVDAEEGLAPLVDALRELVLEGTLPGTYYVWNDLKLLATLRGYPFAELGGRTPLPAAAREGLRAEWDGGRWNVAGEISGATEAIGLARGARIQERLAAVTDRFHVTTEEETAPAGVPSERNLAMAYWRKRAPPPDEGRDPDRDRCGFLWLSVAVPAEGRAAAEAMKIAGEVFPIFGFEPNLSLMGLSARCVYLVAAIAWDREVAGEDAKAMACHHALQRELAAAGFYPARLGVQDADVGFLGGDDETARVLEALKRALDPQGLIAPGRYGLR